MKIPRPLSTVLCVLTSSLLWGPLTALAGNDNLYIEEVMAGANGDSRIQFLVVRQRVTGENEWGPQPGETHSRTMLVFYDRLGRETGTFRFPDDPPTGGTLRTLIATPEFAALTGAPEPDTVIPPLLNPHDGRVCFRDNPLNPRASPIDNCVAYGRAPGNAASAPSLPILETVSLFRDADAIETRRTPAPANIAGDTFTIPIAPMTTQGERLFTEETFAGNGRTCATCHVAGDSFGLTPDNMAARFATLGPPASSFDPLFIAERDFNLNTLRLREEVATPAPCTGDLRGDIATSNGAYARVLSRVDQTTYLVYGGLAPPLTGTVTDGTCQAEVESVAAGDLNAIENPELMRGGQTLILENIDGIENPPVFRRSPHLINLAYTAPYGFSGDFPDLRSFTTGAVIQHFPRTLKRSSDGPDPDFRLPTEAELAAIEAFMLAQEYPPGRDPGKFDLDRFATTAAQRRGREEFVIFGCEACHGGPALSETTISIQGKEAGINAAFSTGTAAGRFRGSLPCEPGTDAVGPCESREFSTPQLFNLPGLGPFFHNGSAATITEAVDFYNTAEFGNSPSNQALIAQGVGVVPTDNIIRFLEGLVERPYALAADTEESGTTRRVTVTNTSPSALRFDDDACRLTGPDAPNFTITSCPLAPMIEAGENAIVEVSFDSPSADRGNAILEVYPIDGVPSGVDLTPP